jgi:hypothetical protein
VQSTIYGSSEWKNVPGLLPDMCYARAELYAKHCRKQEYIYDELKMVETNSRIWTIETALGKNAGKAIEQGPQKQREVQLFWACRGSPVVILVLSGTACLPRQIASVYPLQVGTCPATWGMWVITLHASESLQHQWFPFPSR